MFFFPDLEAETDGVGASTRSGSRFSCRVAASQAGDADTRACAEIELCWLVADGPAPMRGQSRPPGPVTPSIMPTTGPGVHASLGDHGLSSGSDTRPSDTKDFKQNVQSGHGQDLVPVWSDRLRPFGGRQLIGWRRIWTRPWFEVSIFRNEKGVRMRVASIALSAFTALTLGLTIQGAARRRRRASHS